MSDPPPLISVNSDNNSYFFAFVKIYLMHGIPTIKNIPNAFPKVSVPNPPQKGSLPLTTSGISAATYIELAKIKIPHTIFKDHLFFLGWNKPIERNK